MANFNTNLNPASTGLDLGIAGTQEWDLNSQTIVNSGDVTVGGNLSVAGSAGAVDATSLLVNTTQTNTDYSVEIGGGTTTIMRVGASNSDVGGYFTSTVPNDIIMSSASAFNGSNWVAKDALCAQIHVGNDQIEFHCDSGLTPGNTFSPTVRMHLSGNQLTLRSSNAAAPCLARFEEEPTANTGLFFTSDPAVGISVAGTEQFRVQANVLLPPTDATFDMASPSNRLQRVFVGDSGVIFGSAGNVAGVQSNPGGDLFYGNGNARDVTVTCGSGRTIFLGGAIQINGGSNINKVLNVIASLTFGTIAAQTGSEQTISVAGASTTNFGVFASPQTSLGNTNLSWCAWVSAANTISVRVVNPTLGGITPNVVSWGCTINQ